MQFPVMILGFHPHIVFEFLGFLAGFSITLRKSSSGEDSVPPEQRHPLIVAGLVGALVGAKILAWAQHPQTTILAITNEPSLLMGGKTIVGGLLGGMVGVEIAKKAMGIEQRTGDVLLLPIAVGMSFGRVGCFLSGLDDATFGIETILPWGVDFGDGVSRHPTQIYEIIAIWAIVLAIRIRSEASPVPSGWQFRTFMVCYLTWRLFVDWIKPSDWEFLLLTPIQISCIIGLSWYLTYGVISEEEWRSSSGDISSPRQ